MSAPAASSVPPAAARNGGYSASPVPTSRNFSMAPSCVEKATIATPAMPLAMAPLKAMRGWRAGEESAMSQAIAGSAGRMYSGNFELETLKNAMTATAQISSNRSTRSDPSRGAFQASRSAPGQRAGPGQEACGAMGRKYHHAPGRW